MFSFFFRDLNKIELSFLAKIKPILDSLVILGKK